VIAVIELAAQIVGIPAALLLSVCSVESNLRDVTNHNDGGSESWGACQTKYETARFLGFKGRPQDLRHRWNSAYYAAKYLKYQLERYDGMVCDAISSFNMGTMSRFPAGHYRNRRYVRKVLSHLPRFGGSLSLGQHAHCAVGVAG
jgi:soluble lytic murein transglycosylase-like protein